MLVLKAAERIIDGCSGHTLAAVVLVCSTIPANCRLTQAASSEGSEAQHTQPYPEVVRWAGGSYDATRTSIPDGSEEIWRFAHAKWRDESGHVFFFNEALHYLKYDSIPIALHNSLSAMLGSMQHDWGQ
jgi:hypothetical protein